MPSSSLPCPRLWSSQPPQQCRRSLAPRCPASMSPSTRGRIDWPTVASTRVRFVIMRATMGNHYRDGRYTRNLAGATRNGLVVGAYHFAKPGFARRDTRAEADHFLRVARVSAGDVTPVLDIEETGGLSPRQLRIWARAWLERVHARTGVRAMIYAGSHFWHGFMRNTSWFARHGHPLWVAHWYVRAPDVPGRHWGGRGTRPGSGRPPAGSPVSRGRSIETG